MDKEKFNLCLEVEKSIKEGLEKAFSNENIKIGKSKRLKRIKEYLIEDPHPSILKRKIRIDTRNGKVDVTDILKVSVPAVFMKIDGVIAKD